MKNLQVRSKKWQIMDSRRTYYYSLLFLLLSFSNAISQTTLEMGPQGSSLTAEGPSVSNVNVILQKNTGTTTTYTDFTPLTTVTYSISNQQFGPGMPVGTLEGLPTDYGVSFGSAISETQNSPIPPDWVYRLMDYVGSSTNSMFTACATCTPGSGIRVNSNRGVDITLFSDALIQSSAANSGYGHNLYPIDGRIYYGDITLTFNRPVSNPVIHLAGLGGDSWWDVGGNPNYLLGFSTEFDLVGTQYGLSKLSGSDYFSVTGNTIHNSAGNYGRSTQGTTYYGITQYAASGSVAVTGEGITNITFKMYLKGDGGEVRSSSGNATAPVGAYTPLWSRNEEISGDTYVMSVSLDSPILISGTVFDDANGNTLIDGADASLSIPANMYVYLVNDAGVIIDAVNLGTGNTYSFPALQNSNYTIELSTVNYPLGTDTNTTPIDNTLPTNWITTGENGAGNTGAGDGSPDGVLAVSTGSINVTQQNFGIEEKPVVYEAVDTDRPNPGGAATSPVTSTLFTGDDHEDGAYPTNLTGREVTLSPATSGTLYYDGNPVNSPLAITNFDPTKVSIDPDASGSTTGLTGVSPDPIFTYTVKDEAGVESDPETIRVPFTTSLPVKLMSFTATKIETSTDLRWTTTEESNSNRFEVQHSADATNWNVAGMVTASGESKAAKKYIFKHSTPVDGLNYYRLKMIDNDETFAYSHIQSVSFGESSSIIILYPNPTSDVVKIKDLETKKVNGVTMVDMNGKTVYQSSAVSPDGINVKAFSAGIYLIKISHSDGKISTHKIVVSR
ncbi:T9SS type A sorting domain-containing protein [Dyadobacter sp. CY312]|uniref:T9SS type A sorting domain-containing protein n=1 Tax=Dyadobacter sp. CY312 TaxID=2907303 RepID=UPI001F3F3CB2|nr:T9SS type A sorting domain-containing protein [Dyadobacter sp. CY312]MCE7044698.1 T9SS type A sorting domain-containing protein [Dyadobacter sp. CY312]